MQDDKKYKTEITHDGATIHYRYNLWHCEDGPAYIHPDGTLGWYQNGKAHRLDGPAHIYGSSYNNRLPEYYIDGSWYTDQNEYQRHAKLTDEDMTALILRYGRWD